MVAGGDLPHPPFDPDEGVPVSHFRPDQHRLQVAGRTLHFVAYEGRPGRESRGEEAEAPTWYLMCEGHRLPVMPHVAGQSESERNAALLAWALANAVDPDQRRRPPARAVPQDVE